MKGQRLGHECVPVNESAGKKRCNSIIALIKLTPWAIQGEDYLVWCAQMHLKSKVYRDIILLYAAELHNRSHKYLLPHYKPALIEPVSSQTTYNTERGGSIYWCLGGFLCVRVLVWKEVHPGHWHATSSPPAAGCPTAAGDSPGKWCWWLLDRAAVAPCSGNTCPKSQ